MRNLLNMFATWLVKVTAKKSSLEKELDKVDMTGKVRIGAIAERRTCSVNRDEMDVRNIDKGRPDSFQFARTLEDIQAELLAKGYTALREILEQYDTPLIQQYVGMQLNLLGEHQPEHDNLDSISRENLIPMACELNQLLFRQRMIEQGKAQVTDAQRVAIEKMAKKLGRQIEMPKDKFTASDLIVELKHELGEPEQPKYDNMTDAQHRAVAYLCKALGRDSEAVMKDCTSIKTTSNVIADLQAELALHPELAKPSTASTAQIDYLKRLYKMNDKRWTKVQEEKWSKATSKEVSAKIEEMNKLYQDTNPNANMISEGQTDYIVMLLTKLDRPYSMDDIKKMTKAQATLKIDGLRRDWLHMLYKACGQDISREDIGSMRPDSVKAQIQQLLEELKLKDYANMEEGR
jgi:hypothetical protein